MHKGIGVAIKFLFFFVLLSCSTPRSDKETVQNDWSYRPSFKGLTSNSDNSKLSMNCLGDPPFDEIQCRFNMIWVVAPMSEESLSEWSLKTKKEYKAKLDKAFWSAEKLKKFEQQRKENETSLKEAEDYYQKSNLNIYKIAYDRLTGQLEREVHRCMDQKTKDSKKACLVEKMVRLDRLRYERCTIKDHESGYFAFKRTEPGKWVSIFELCRTRTTRTLVFTGEEKDWSKKIPENKDWIFLEESVGIAMDPRMKEMCKDSQPITNSSKYEFYAHSTALMKCDVIHFD